MTTLVNRLDWAGCVRRKPHTFDRRRLVLEPTELTSRLGLEFLGTLHIKIVQALEQLPDTETAATRKVLATLHTVVADHRPPE